MKNMTPSSNLRRKALSEPHIEIIQRVSILHKHKLFTMKSFLENQKRKFVLFFYL
jgi:hypothetical protein